MREFLKQQIFPGFSAIVANRKIQKIFDKQLKYEVVLPAKIKDVDKFRTDIESLIKNQLERKSKLEDKAKSLLFIITLAITTATFSLNFLKETPERLVSPLLAILSICCFVFAGIRVISAINIRMFYIGELPIAYEKIEDNEEIKGRLVVSENSTNEYLHGLVYNKALNDLICAKIANLTYASFTLVRNGIILFACFFAVSIVVQFYTPKKNQDIKINSLKQKNGAIQRQKPANNILIKDSIKLNEKPATSKKVAIK
jgi:hypothetical protein